MAPQYKSIYSQMIKENSEDFMKFTRLYEKREENFEKYKAEFNQIGEEIQSIIKKYESILCGRTEGAGFGMYSSKLAEKFWTLIRAEFPYIDDVGLV